MLPWLPVPDPAQAAHRPVLLAEAMALLAPAPGRRVLDCTLGMGGHAEAVLEAGADLVGIDRDPRARELAQARLARFASAAQVLGGTFGSIGEALVESHEQFHGVLADLGVSSMQLDDPIRGFSIRSSAPADMRMGEGCSEDALSLIDRLSDEELADIIYRYGEERHSRRIARALRRARAQGVPLSCESLAEVVRRAVPGHARRHPAIRTFQALRIAVNDEIGQIERLLACLPRLLVPGGIAVVISFHSLEDRAVKHSFRELLAAGSYDEIARRVTVPSDDECSANPRAGSAKLRWARTPSTPSTPAPIHPLRKRTP